MWDEGRDGNWGVELVGDHRKRNNNKYTNGNNHSSSNKYWNRRNANIMVIMTEFFHSFRPLLWAWCEARYPLGEVGIPQQQSSRSNRSTPFTSKSLLYAWWICLGMDLVSLRLLRQATLSSSTSSSYRNLVTQEELSQRKMRLWLYSLRLPVCDYTTKPVIIEQFVSQRILHRCMPSWLGNLLETFLMDWI
jgi:hypothetical protein